MNVIEYYMCELIMCGYQFDFVQCVVVDCLQCCFDEWVEYKVCCLNVFKKFINYLDFLCGVYMWGGVGCGKSFLMDSFYVVVFVQCKMCLYFYEFMCEVYCEFEELKGQVDLFDEFV